MTFMYLTALIKRVELALSSLQIHNSQNVNIHLSKL